MNGILIQVSPRGKHIAAPEVVRTARVQRLLDILDAQQHHMEHSILLDATTKAQLQGGSSLMHNPVWLQRQSGHAQGDPTVRLVLSNPVFVR